LFDANSGFEQRIHKISGYFEDIRGENQERIRSSILKSRIQEASKQKQLEMNPVIVFGKSSTTDIIN
jgi:hypothetical protein